MSISIRSIRNSLLVSLALILVFLFFLDDLNVSRSRNGAICGDGWESSSTGRGTCSHHGGVDYWTYDEAGNRLLSLQQRNIVWIISGLNLLAVLTLTVVRTRASHKGSALQVHSGRAPVVSPNMRSIGYDPIKRVLQIEFLSGAVYEYFDVPDEVWRELMTTKALDTYFKNNIKRGSYIYRRL